MSLIGKVAICRKLRLAAALCLAPLIAHTADEASELSQVTVTATRSAAPVADVPATVTVISAAQIEAQLAENIEDLVRFEPGVSVRSAPARFTAAGASTGRDGNSGFNIRGLEGNRAMVQVDGIRTPDAYSFGAQSVGRGDYVDLGILKSVEILRGPASALYGSDGVAGAVSFITKDPADLLGAERQATLRLRSAYADADETFSHSLVGATRFGGWEGLVAYTRRDGEGQQTQGTNNAANTDRTTSNPEDNRSNAALLKLVRPIDANNQLRFTWDHLDRDVDWMVLSAIAKPPLTATSTLGLKAFDAMERDRLTFEHLYEGEGRWLRSLRTAVFLQDSHTRQYSSEDRSAAADRIRDATFDNRVHGALIEATSRLEAGALSHRFVYGADLTRTRQQSTRDGTVPPPGETFPTHAFPITDYQLAGVFVQDELRWERLSLFPALRWDSFRLEPRRDPLFVAAIPTEQSDSRVSPKLGALWRLGGPASLFANAAAGFKAPAPNQVNNGFTNPVNFYRSVSNPDLKPETSRTLEAGLRLEAERWRAGVTGYTGRYKDFIEQVQVSGSMTSTDPAVFQYVNLAGASIHGVEARSRVRFAPGFAFSLAAAWTRGKSERQGIKTPLPSVDPLKVVGGIDFEPNGGRFGGQLVTTFVDRKEASRLGVACSGGCYVPGGYVVVDAIGWWRATDHATLRAGAFNLTDRRYTAWSDVRGLAATSVVKDAYSQPGRNLSLSVTLQF